ncbi:MAG: SDR family NAD(P)-dependent oxidoreductase [Oscillospiraceae bacterium]|jgi:NAD(P)-dependent dehydrogenase (short-subunit alcohol dehydrogenase family)|nr:SDR family NAD(P)-dependent oxidoreductase [Oscillospiraceae bacterium]
MRPKTILVAGASSGLGLAVAQALARAGHRVFAGARSFAGQPEIAPEGFVRLPLDVTDALSAQRAVDAARARAGEIDALIYCAARIVLGACEDTDTDELRAVLETNFLGLTTLTRAVLPGMRAQGRGLIVPFSSINGLLGIPCTGAYVASKHAIEGWAECLRMETRPWGIGVCVVRPGDHCGGSAAYRPYARAAATSAYAGDFAQAVSAIARDEASGLPPDRLARAVVRIVGRKRPPAQITVAKADQRLAAWLHDLLPVPLFSAIIRGYYIKNR